MFLPAIAVFHLGIALAQETKADACPRGAEAFAVVEKKAEAHDPAAQTALAFCYDLGQHVRPDGKASIHWLTEAAGQGYAPAEYELGRIYLYGRGVPADYASALLWEQKAAQQGDARAQRDLAFMYERGLGVPVDAEQAAEWNRKAAAQGHAEAQFHLAKALNEGAGVAKNPEEARQWYGKAARQEQPAAQLELAREFAGQRNCPLAVRWYEEAAGHGQPQAMYELGRLYLSGMCGRNRGQAFTWFTIGEKFGSPESRQEAASLSKALSASEKKAPGALPPGGYGNTPGVIKKRTKKRRGNAGLWRSGSSENRVIDHRRCAHQFASRFFSVSPRLRGELFSF
jgi:uncharacterized protein